MARPDEKRRFVLMLTLFTYLESRGMFEKQDAFAEERSLPVSQVAADLGLSEEETEQLAEMLACCGQDPQFLIPLYLDDEEGELRIYTSYFPAPERPLRLSSAECVALCKALEPLGSKTTGRLIAQLQDAVMVPGFARSQTDQVSLELDHPEQDRDQALVEQLRSAMENCQVVRIAYRSTGQEFPTVRDVEPLELYREGNRWFLSAFCHRRQDVRTFKLESISQLFVTSKIFAPRLEQTTRFSQALQGDLEQAVLAVAPDYPLERREWPGLQITETAPDGTRTMTIPYTGSAWLADKVIATLGGVRAVAPASLVKRVQERSTLRYRNAQESLQAWRDVDADRYPDLIGVVQEPRLSEPPAGSWREALQGTISHKTC